MIGLGNRSNLIKTIFQTRRFAKTLGIGDAGRYVGAQTKFTGELNIQDPINLQKMDTYRVMNEHGKLLKKGYKIQLGDEQLLKMYETMITLSTMDQIFYDAQRQGRISFYMTNAGEEASHIGSAEPLSLDDVVYMQYREAGVLLWRGFGLQQTADQLFSNVDDLGKGRQMPVHYGSRALNMQTVSSPLSTQIPQAAGAAYGLKLEKKNAVVMCYFGEGSASEGDFHAAMNFAATLSCPVIFFCRNNGYAISTDTGDQYCSKFCDGIVGRGSGYGISSVRVDGNDILAVNDVVREAKAIAIDQNRPILIEAMTYRGGHHSTSDDSTRYRDTDELKYWEEFDHPIIRFRRFLMGRGLLTKEMDSKFDKKIRVEIMEAFANAEKKLKPKISNLFTDVYDVLTPHLSEQKAELDLHLSKYPEKYKLGEYSV